MSQQRTGQSAAGSSALSTRDLPSIQQPVRGSVEFLRGFLRNPAQVGSVTPSSRRLEQRLVRNAGIAQAQTVVELGPGTGGTTAAMLRAMGPAARLLAIELDPDFHRHLRSSLHDPRLALELGSAERMAELLQAHGMAAPDAIVSGIPFSTMPPEVSERIAAAIAGVPRDAAAGMGMGQHAAGSCLPVGEDLASVPVSASFSLPAHACAGR